MLIVPPIQFRPKRETGQSVAAVSRPLAQAQVVAVLSRGGQMVTWFFSVPVTLTGDVPQLILDTDAGPQAPSDFGVLSDYALNVLYEAGDIGEGVVWHMDTAAGLSFGSVPVVVPQSGTVIA